ncbi:hypothetical protein BCh11DRAFT_03304 [Burkholderia sp. Ch1-1]|uniref:Uncharacterized protein n=1 Tax=Paraburkholderia dioscoreae TaxID=2604047 RepID=A0A5Q4Z2V5_9BURK|nr:hypothetical protein BCh11DRAFT_03304 [Burkholderia sp. Ch1-1]VVD31374.1 conserved protein of unknown function [Paraburkholderia dioscoreae]
MPNVTIGHPLNPDGKTMSASTAKLLFIGEGFEGPAFTSALTQAVRKLRVATRCKARSNKVR